jgi:hypothetical protein
VPTGKTPLPSRGFVFSGAVAAAAASQAWSPLVVIAATWQPAFGQLRAWEGAREV